MFKTFGTSEEVFVNQDEGMFIAFPITLDTSIHTLETETEGGNVYVKAGSVVKEDSVVLGILAERYLLVNGIAQARVVVEGYAWASKLTDNAIASASSLPKIVIMPYKAIVLSLVSNNGLVAFLHAEGARFASTIATSDITATGASVTSVAVQDNGDLKVTFSQAGDVSITAFDSDAFTGVTGATVKGLPISFTTDASTKYAVTATAGDNGSVSVDKATAAEGEIVTITATPASTYSIDKITVDGTEITAVGGSYTFVMPGKAVAVVATFKA